MQRTIKKTHQQGFALLLSIIVSSVVLAIGISILEVSVNQINLSATARESEFAFQTAHAGMDCIWYWRNENADVFTLEGAPALPVSCFGTAPVELSEALLLSNTDGYINQFNYTFQWGDPQRCSDVQMYVFNAESGNLSWNFDNNGIGNDGVKECAEGNICTVLVSQGYNRSCTELSSSIFSIQREIVVEF